MEYRLGEMMMEFQKKEKDIQEQVNVTAPFSNTRSSEVQNPTE